MKGKSEIQKGNKKFVKLHCLFSVACEMVLQKYISFSGCLVQV